MAFREPSWRWPALERSMSCSGVQGILVDDPADLVGAMDKLMMRDCEVAQSMGEIGYRTVTGHFSFDAFVSRLWSVMAEAVPAPTRCPADP